MPDHFTMHDHQAAVLSSSMLKLLHINRASTLRVVVLVLDINIFLFDLFIGVLKSIVWGHSLQSA